MARSAQTTPEEKLERILDAAGELFARDGYRQVPVDAIASRAGVSKGLIYVHFASKEALLARVLQRSMTGWFDEAVRSAYRADVSAPEMLAATLRSSIRYVKGDPVLCGILAQDPRLLLFDGGAPQKLVQGYTRTMANLVRFGIQRGDFRKDLDPEATAASLWLFHDSLVRELFVSRTLADRAPEKVLEGAIDLLLGGLLARPK